MDTQFIAGIEPRSVLPGAALRILPAGKFRSTDTRPADVDAWRMDAHIAQGLIAAAAQHGPHVIDYEHQSLNAATNGQPAPAAGWFKGLEWREGEGLFMAQIEWTATARKMIANGEYRYLSPMFRYDGLTGAVTVLYGVALTNIPGLAGLTDLAAATARIGSAPDAQLSEKDKTIILRAFGDIPGFYEATGIKPEPAPNVLQADLSALTEQERANFARIFGIG
ncbi:MAG: phage protease [Azonexus sp.]|jgi:phage I-like protein|nr:phage protease [Azonexus sp.]